ncbi:protein kinase [Streptomyces sp. SID3343]|nr:protein kinase [Streptomyces sp. SID3343]
MNPTVQPISPALRWHAQDDTWIALGFDAVDGRSSDLAPNSPDLPAVVETLNRIGDLNLPSVAREWAETRWNRFAANDAEAALFQGDELLHTDINPSNLMIGATDTWAVDWSWPTRGAGFIDPACLVIQLVAAGHSAASAESWASECPAWNKADPAAVSAFAAATLRMYRAFAERKPDTAWLGAMVAAAESWTSHRGVVA